MLRRFHLSVLVAAYGIATWSCSGSPAGQQVPAKIEIVSGNAQTGVVGAELGSALAVKVTDAGGVPVRASLVRFVAAAGSGSALAGLAITDKDGIAQDHWTLATKSGQHGMVARVLDSTTGEPLASVSFDATAIAGAPKSVVLVGGDGQVARPGTTLGMPLQARVTDQYGNPVAAAAVTFIANPTDGSAMPSSVQTDATGSATVTWTLSTAAGTQTLDVAVAGATLATFKATAQPPLAASSDIGIVGNEPGVTPFINFLKLSGSSLGNLTSVRYTIAPKPGSVSKAVEVRCAIDALIQRRYYVAGSSSLVVPVFGLYSGYTNGVSISLQFSDDSSQRIVVNVTTAPYLDPNAVYDHGVILKSRVPGTVFGFDFFYIKSGLGTPVVVDTDGEIRWIGTGLPNATSSLLDTTAFIVGATDSPALTRLEFDGSMSKTFLRAPTYTKFHHNMDAGKQAWLGEFDVSSGGINHIESTLAEVAPSGGVLKEWDLEVLLSEYMLKNGDDPTAFVRPGVDWFHMNAAMYDPTDDSVIVSSRENFVVKLDYTSGDVIWIFGDPTKYWYTFPSLRAKALNLADGGLYPIGQHAVSLTRNGLLLLFNNGLQSFNQPAGQPAGASRTYSAVSAYLIDAAALTASEVWRFDYDQTILSTICSSASEMSDGSVLISYAFADAGSHARLVGLSSAHDVVFDLQYPNPGGCSTSWNAQSIPLEKFNLE